MVFSILNSATSNRHQTETDSHQNSEAPLSKDSGKDSIIFLGKVWSSSFYQQNWLFKRINRGGRILGSSINILNFYYYLLKISYSHFSVFVLRPEATYQFPIFTIEAAVPLYHSVFKAS